MYYTYIFMVMLSYLCWITNYPKIWWLNQDLSSYSFCGSRIQEQFSSVVLAHSLPRGCSPDVGHSNSHLKAWPMLEAPFPRWLTHVAVGKRPVFRMWTTSVSFQHDSWLPLKQQFSTEGNYPLASQRTVSVFCILVTWSQQILLSINICSVAWRRIDQYSKDFSSSFDFGTF